MRKGLISATQSAALIFAIAISYQANADRSLSYVDGSIPFIAIDNVNREAQAWGTCAAIYEVSAYIFAESKPAQARLYKDLSNGASMAVVMSHVIDGMASISEPEDFNSLWNYSKTLADSTPEVSKNMILADAEMLGGDGNEFLGKVVATIEVCMENLESQQNYIDSWKELAKSGLLTLPAN